jgi:hypothetical protein
MSKPTEVLLERAIILIMDEWGYTRERALEWLNDDTQDWTPRPQYDAPGGTFMQVTRKTVVAPESVCCRCGRKSWSNKPGDACNLPQPDGPKCPGVFMNP